MEMIRPYKLLRRLLRFVLSIILAWLLLVVVWIALPFPSYEAIGNGTEYAKSVLKSGKGLTRVYFPTDRFGIRSEKLSYYRGFALDYHLNIPDLALSISGLETPLPIIFPDQEHNSHTDPIQVVNVTVRAGDEDGANLPWFPKADAVLLYWWIHKDTFQLQLVAKWSIDGARNVLALRATSDASLYLLEISIENGDLKSIKVEVPPNVQEEDLGIQQGLSSSPSMTYPVRIALISIIAPTALFANEHFGSLISTIYKPLFMAFTSLGVLFAILLYGFLTGAVVVSVCRCLKIRSARVDVFLERIDVDSWTWWVLQVCREGWHPERIRARMEEGAEERDLERGDNGEGARRALQKLLLESKSKVITKGN